MSWKSMEEMYEYFGDCLNEEEFEKEKKEVEDFLGDCKDFEFYEDKMYGELFIVRRGEEYFIVSGYREKLIFDRLDEEDIKLIR